MAKTQLEMVQEFHSALEIPISQVPVFPSAQRVRLRYRLIQEELGELVEALLNSDLVEVADALADIVYVVNGAALEFGIDLDAVFEEVHRSNMTKVPKAGEIKRRSDGKILKSESYKPPNIAAVIWGDESFRKMRRLVVDEKS